MSNNIEDNKKGDFMKPDGKDRLLIRNWTNFITCSFFYAIYIFTGNRI